MCRHELRERQLRGQALRLAACFRRKLYKLRKRIRFAKLHSLGGFRELKGANAKRGTLQRMGRCRTRFSLGASDNCNEIHGLRREEPQYFAPEGVVTKGSGVQMF